MIDVIIPTMVKAVQELNEKQSVLDDLLKIHEEKQSAGVKTKTVEIAKDNLIHIEGDYGAEIPPIPATNYDYNDQFSFREKDKK